MPALGDLLSDHDRRRLEHLADPNPGLAEAARAALAEAAGPGRLAWAAVAVALAKTRTPAEARAALTGMLEDGELRSVALSCLDTLASDPGTDREMPS